MEQRTLEGTWEEILRYSPELVGLRGKPTRNRHDRCTD
jgi:hypothetical protein